MTQKKRLYGKSRDIPVLKNNIQTQSWIRRGKIRKFVFLHIKDKTMPADLVAELAGAEKRKSGSFYAQVSRALEELEQQGLIECLNPREKTGRLYSMTKAGKALLRQIESKQQFR